MRGAVIYSPPKTRTLQVIVLILTWNTKMSLSIGKSQNHVVIQPKMNKIIQDNSTPNTRKFSSIGGEFRFFLDISRIALKVEFYKLTQ